MTEALHEQLQAKQALGRGHRRHTLDRIPALKAGTMALALIPSRVVLTFPNVTGPESA